MTDNVQPYQGNKSAKWVRVTYNAPGGDTLIAGAAVDKYGTRAKAIAAAKKFIISKL